MAKTPFTIKAYVRHKLGHDVMQKIDCMTEAEAKAIRMHMTRNYMVSRAWLKNNLTQVSTLIFPIQKQKQVRAGRQVFHCPDCGKLHFSISIKCSLNCHNYLNYISQ